MMKKPFRQTVIVLIIILLLPFSSYAGTVDDLLTNLSRSPDYPNELVFKAELVRLPQFSDIRTGWLNQLLDHLTFRIRSDGNLQEEIIEADEKAVIEHLSRKMNGKTENRFSFSEKIYRSENEDDFLSLLTGNSPEDDLYDYYTQFQILLPEFYRFFSGLPELFPDSVSESKVSIQYKGYGTAVKRYAMVLGSDVLASEIMTDYLSRDDLSNVRQFLSQIVLSGKQRLTLLRDAEGNLMKVNYTAKCGMSEESIRNTDLDWKCLNRENGYKDVLVLKTPAVTGTDRHNVTLSRESVLQPDGTEQYECSIDTDEVRNKNRNRVRMDIRLTGAEKRITGNAVRKKTASGTTEINEYTINVTTGENEDYQGSLEIKHELNKIEREHFRIDFTYGSCEAPVWENGDSVSISEDEVQSIRQKAAGAFLRAMKNIPEEDLGFILADLPDNWWNQIQISEKPEETEKP